MERTAIMRYSEPELTRMAFSAITTSTMQGRLLYKGIQQGKLRPVRELQGQVFREREFRLQGNFLFYYRPSEDRRGLEPLGALLLERCTVQREMNAEKGFVFSIAFQEDRERKHYFLAPTTQQCDQWVLAIRNASYEQLKATWLMLRTKISRLKDMQSQAMDKEQHLQKTAPPIPLPTRAAPPRRPPPRPTTDRQLQPQQPPLQPQQPPLQPQQPPLQPRRNAPSPPTKAASSTPREPAEGLLVDLDFS